MLINCSECQSPITESVKNRPPNLAPNIKWFMCRECDRGIEIVGDPASEDLGKTTSMTWEETITMKQYITVKKTKNGVIKYRYSDPARTVLIGEEPIG